MPQRRRLFIFLFLGCLTVPIGFIPDLVSDELKAWCLRHLGPSYSLYFIVFYIVGCFVLLAFSGEFRGVFSLSRRTSSRQPGKIAWSQEGIKLLQAALDKLEKAQLVESIEILSELKNPLGDEQLSLLSARLTKYYQDNRIGVLNSEQKETTFNRISKDLFDLIKSIENQLSEGEKEYQQMREAFRQRYRDRLVQKLAFRQPVNLRRMATSEGTSERVAATFLPYSGEAIREEIGKTFLESYGRLLIVGQPGAGKTTLLLQLADRIFDLEPDALPVVLNLATWQSSYRKLETWLENVLAAELSTNKAGARAVLRQTNLILLLDGLDELKEDEAISACLAAIADYGATPGRRFVITCRIEEYKRVQEDARVNLQIEVGPLQGDQLEVELTRMGREQPEALPLLQAIQSDPLLRQAVETPFYLNTLQLLFAGRLPVFTTNDLESRKAEIMDIFVTSKLDDTENKYYPPASAMRWLSFLASRMNERNKVVFELRDLQYDWFKGWPWLEIVVSIFINELVNSLKQYILFMLFIGLSFWMLPSLIVSVQPTRIHRELLFVTGMFCGFVLSVFELAINSIIQFMKKIRPGISTRDFHDWSLTEKLRSINIRWHWTLVFILFVLTTINLLGYLQGVLFFIIIVVLIGLIYFLDQDKNPGIIQIKTPYHRFNASMKVLHFSKLQHFHLRYLLYKKGVLPLRLVDFLNEMSDRHLMETDGATWRFRHRIIQDYFAEKWEEE
ncbi:MAG: NACHT domain-containing protein [Saprospiraceae bacterium]|nr:NACHT domain-containing protein [Saprospiraceae bacterium]